MIVLTVLSYNGAPADGPSAQFDELGGTIGRADINQLVLPDPERTISRVHARVVFRGGKYAIVDNGSNPISVNGTPVGAGREQPLQPGDELQIGGYVLKAGEVTLGAAAADPFADLFGDAAMGLAAPPASAKPMRPAAAPAPAPAPAAPAWHPPAPAPIPSPPAAWQAPPPVPPPSRAVGHIPEDWDPFAPDPVADQPQPTAVGTAAHAIFDLPRGGGDSIDDLFDLSGAPSKADPLGASPAHANRAAPNMAAHDDPLQSLASAGSPDLPSRSDHFSDLNTPMPRPSPPPASAAAPLPAGAVFSWNDPPRDGRVVTLPGVRRPGMETPADVPAAAPVAAPIPTPMPAPAPAPAWSAPRPAATASGDQGELLAALLAGLGTPGLRLDALTPATMQLIGQLLRESMRGTVELLVARAALKREMRAEMTMIVARENNPLKFSPSAEVALQHLLGPT